MITAIGYTLVAFFATLGFLDKVFRPNTEDGRIAVWTISAVIGIFIFIWKA